MEPRELLKRIAELEKELAERDRDLGRFRSELGKANERLESLISQLQVELKTAHVIQKALVPTELPHIPGFEFSSKFVPSFVTGGDYFDIFEHEDRLRFGLILASSSGHAMSALLLSVLLKLTSQMEARKGADPHTVLMKMAQELVPNIPENSSADVFYAMIDRRSFEMSYTKVGEVITLFQNYTTGEIQPLEAQAEAYQASFNSKLKSKSIALNPRDRLIFCTRGVTEAKNLKGESFGIERVIKSILEAPKLGVHELRNHLLYAVQKFTSTVEPSRDCTILVVEVKDRVIKLAKNIQS